MHLEDDVLVAIWVSPDELRKLRQFRHPRSITDKVRDAVPLREHGGDSN